MMTSKPFEIYKLDQSIISYDIFHFEQTLTASVTLSTVLVSLNMPRIDHLNGQKDDCFL